MAFQQFLDSTSPVVGLVRLHMERGLRVREAMDYVMGEGSYDKFVREIYDSIRASAA